MSTCGVCPSEHTPQASYHKELSLLWVTDASLSFRYWASSSLLYCVPYLGCPGIQGRICDHPWWVSWILRCLSWVSIFPTASLHCSTFIPLSPQFLTHFHILVIFTLVYCLKSLMNKKSTQKKNMYLDESLASYPDACSLFVEIIFGRVSSFTHLGVLKTLSCKEWSHFFLQHPERELGTALAKRLWYPIRSTWKMTQLLGSKRDEGEKAAWSRTEPPNSTQNRFIGIRRNWM